MGPKNVLRCRTTQRRTTYVLVLIDEIRQVTIYCVEQNMNILIGYIWMRYIKYRLHMFYVNEIRVHELMCNK